MQFFTSYITVNFLFPLRCYKIYSNCIEWRIFTTNYSGCIRFITENKLIASTDTLTLHYNYVSSTLTAKYIPYKTFLTYGKNVIWVNKS